MTVKMVVPTSGSLPGRPPPSEALIGRRQRRADHTRLVGEVCGPQLGLRTQQGSKLREALTHRAPENKYVGPQEPLYRGQILVDALDPGRKIKLLERARMRRGALLSIYAVHLQVTELGVGKELAAAKQCRANAGAEGQHDDGTAA